MISEFLRRYFRATVDFPEGKIVHHADCLIYSKDVCNCGLLHDLEPLSEDIILKLYPEYYQDMVKVNKRLENE